MFGCPDMFACPLYVWTCPVCLDAPYVLMHPLYVWMPTCLDVWTPPICVDNVWMPPYIHNTKKACFVTQREDPYAPIHLDAPCIFG